MILEASQYNPAFDNTMVPTAPDAVTNPDSWEMIYRDDFTTAHAQALIDHFNAVFASDPTFNVEQAINTQLTPK
jgi:hypothetical protein